ncbi:unnamed protein product [Closterium sp. NIES-64]|nr:unnamed protein product [Closterium sp. NIES-64]
MVGSPTPVLAKLLPTAGGLKGGGSSGDEFEKLRSNSFVQRAIGILTRSPPQTAGMLDAELPTWGSAAWEDQVRLSATPRAGGMVVLVTGAAGFVGSHTSLALKERGDGVVGIDNFNDYYPPALKRARQQRLESKGVFIVDGDINDAALLAKLFELVKFTHVLQLAAQAGVRYAVVNPLAYVHSNVAGFVTLLEQAKSVDPAPAMVYASSSSVYGLNSKVPFSEDDRTDRPASLYAATKKADEVLGHTYNHIYGLSITALRFFTVYGPWGRPDMAYFAFARNIMQGKPIKVFRGPKGEELARDFTYIDDVVKGCLGALDTAEPSIGAQQGQKKGKKRRAQFRVFNLGNTQPVKVGEFVGILERQLGVKAIRKVIPMPSTGDVMFTHANITRAAREFSYQPTTDLETGLSKFVQWYKSYYREGSGNEHSLDGYKPY